VLLVTRLDQLARSTRDLLNVLDTISKKGARFRMRGPPQQLRTGHVNRARWLAAAKAPNGVDVFFGGMSDEISGRETLNRHCGTQDKREPGGCLLAGLKEIAGGRNMKLTGIDTERQDGNLSSAIRLFVLSTYQGQISERQGGAPEQRVA
jgi:hypothetical protein